MGAIGGSDFCGGMVAGEIPAQGVNPFSPHETPPQSLKNVGNRRRAWTDEDYAT
jgi:hypothetical protein